MPIIKPKVVPVRKWTEEEHRTWYRLFSNLDENRRTMAVPEFAEGIEVLGITAERIPDLDQVNRILRERTGWTAVPVEGLEGAASFYPMLAQKQFPIGNFIREPHDLSYTPAPDIFHDLYGHLPFFIRQDYADFCEEFGKRSIRYVDRPEILREWERLFWLTIEFGLLDTGNGRRIFGGGILSSHSESEYALSDQPRVYPFDLERIRNTEFRIDVFQETLIELPSRQALFECLEAYEKPYLAAAG